MAGNAVQRQGWAALSCESVPPHLANISHQPRASAVISCPPARKGRAPTPEVASPFCASNMRVGERLATEPEPSRRP